MGYIRHHAIIVTSWNERDIAAAHVEALRHFEHISEIIQSPINGYRSFFVAPDGSKEGWDDSDAGDESRRLFTAWLDRRRHEDGSSNLAWVEVFYGDDEREVGIVRDGDMHRRGDEATKADTDSSSSSESKR